MTVVWCSGEERLRAAVLGPNGERREKVTKLLEAHLMPESELGRTRLRVETEAIDKSRPDLERALALLRSSSSSSSASSYSLLPL
jgi:hypothetical protein